MLDAVRAEGVLPGRVVVGDSGYGVGGPLRAGLAERGLHYVLGVTGEMVVFLEEPRWRVPGPGRRARPRLHHRLETGRARPLNLREVAARSPGVRAPGGRWPGALSGCACGLPTALATGECAHQEPIWLLIEEQPDGTIKYAFSNLPVGTTRLAVVRRWRQRWKIEQGYQQMKEELGLDHFEGRTYRGFHHHGTLVMLAFGFLALEQLCVKQEQKAPAKALPASRARKKSRAHQPRQ